MTGFKSLIRISADPQNSDTDIDHGKITCPTMVMWGVADNFMSASAAEKLKERISGPTRVQYIERAGHWVQEDRPDEVARYINDFVTEWDGVNL